MNEPYDFDIDWALELPAAITVTNEHGVILQMNYCSRATFASKGGAELIGKDVLACHPEPARSRAAALYREQRPNHYTIRKNGQQKIIHQIPWYREGVFAGLVEISIPIPDSSISR